MTTTTRLSDAIVPTMFSGYMSKDTTYKQALWGTGVLRSDADLAAKLAGGGLTFNVPFWKDLDDTESDAASDDPDSHAVPGKLTSGTDIAERIIRTKGWSTANLVSELAGSDPMRHISQRVGDYWGREFDRMAINEVRGVIADNIANDGGDMVKDISTDAGGAPSASELFSAEALMDAAQTMGDNKDVLKVLVMHSVVQTRLAKLDLIDFRPDSEGTQFFPYYTDFRVMISDQAPAIAGTNRIRYHTYLLGQDAIGWAESPVDKPVEVESDPSAGDGMGTETLWTRRQVACHVYGVKWTGAQVGGMFPTNAELRLAANHDRVYVERKQIPLACLISNG